MKSRHLPYTINPSLNRFHYYETYSKNWFLLEAMPAGKPWVSTNVGSVTELKGGIISTTSANALISNLSKLLQDSNLRNSLGKQVQSNWALNSPQPQFIIAGINSF